MCGRFLQKLRSFLRVNADELERLVDVVMSVEGQISRAEARKLIELAQNIGPNTVIIEIGTYRGSSAIALAFGSLLGHRNRVYAIDPHFEFQGIFGGQYGPEDQAALYHNLDKAGVGNIVSVISLPSIAAAKSWTLKNVGLLWIDGDHRSAAVCADYQAWHPFVVIGGIVAFHDNGADGVKRLICELIDAGSITPLGQVGTLSWFRWEGEGA